MSAATTVQKAEQQLLECETDTLVKSIGIPPRPSILLDLQKEVTSDDPNFKRIAALIGADVALTIALLKVANSPMYGLSRRCESVEQAISMLGLRQVGQIVTSLVLRKVLRTDGPMLTRFWDVSAKRSFAVGRLARSVGGVDFDVGQSFGLFCDVGIPLLMQRFPEYGQTLKRCNEANDASFTEVEHWYHQTDHALVGGMMARSWGASPTLALAIRLHHDYSIFQDPGTPEPVTRLIAMGLLAEVAIQRFAGLNAGTEWDKGGDYAASALMLGDHDVEDWVDRLIEDFALGKA